MMARQTRSGQLVTACIPMISDIINVTSREDSKQRNAPKSGFLDKREIDRADGSG
jgi:hypothetical protein